MRRHGRLERRGVRADGCGALLAAAAGARVHGLDAAPRLIEVARARAAEAGLDVEFVVGDALDLPFDDGAFDAVVSVFGVIFVPDPARAIGGASPEAYFAVAEEHHPMSLAGRPLLEAAGTYPAVREEAIGVLRAGNEDPAGFRVTSPYRVMRLDVPVTR
jgi:SAM-dependent methyltransferase